MHYSVIARPIEQAASVAKIGFVCYNIAMAWNHNLKDLSQHGVHRPPERAGRPEQAAFLHPGVYPGFLLSKSRVLGYALYI